MSLATGKARYADLVEWQLHNAAAVGISFSGDSYFYRNPLSANGGARARLLVRDSVLPLEPLPPLGSSRPPRGRASRLRAADCSQYVSGRISLSGGARIFDRLSLPLGWEGPNEGLSCPSPMRLRLRKPGWANTGRALVDGTERLAFSRKDYEGACLSTAARSAAPANSSQNCRSFNSAQYLTSSSNVSCRWLGDRFANIRCPAANAGTGPDDRTSR